jgi:hypothetical protein
MLFLLRGGERACELFLCARSGGHCVRSGRCFLVGEFHSKKVCVLSFSHKT